MTTATAMRELKRMPARRLESLLRQTDYYDYPWTEMVYRWRSDGKGGLIGNMETRQVPMPAPMASKPKMPTRRRAAR